jgi:hypothetical protein
MTIHLEEVQDVMHGGSKLKTALTSEPAKTAYKIGFISALGALDVIAGMPIYGAALKTAARTGLTFINPIQSKVGDKLVTDVPTAINNYMDLTKFISDKIIDAINIIV